MVAIQLCREAKIAKTAKDLLGFFVMAKRLILGGPGDAAKNDRCW